MNVPRFLALRGLQARPRQFAVCILGVVLGVLSLGVILAVYNGFETALVESILETSGHVVLASATHAISSWEALADEVRARPDVTAVSPCILGQCILDTGSAFSGVKLRGIDPGAEEGISRLSSRITSGSFSFEGSNEIILGAPLASQLGVAPGGRLRLVCPDGEGYDMRLAGIFDTGVTQFDFEMAFVPLRFAQRALGYGEQVSHLLVRLSTPMEADLVAAELAGATGLRATSWFESNKTLLSAIAMERRVTILVLILTLVVSGFGIANVLTMAVYEKYRDIGILRAMGASPGLVRATIMLQGLAVGLVGAVAGTLGAFLVGAALRTWPIPLPDRIYYTDKVPVEFHALDVVLVAVAAVAVATLAGLLPARKAVAVHPWEAIRHYQ